MPSHVGTIHPQAGVKGWDVTQSVWEARQEIQSFVAAADVAKGEWVQIAVGLSGGSKQEINTVKKAVATALGNPLVVGVALEAAKAGEVIRVCTAGLCNALCETTVNAEGLCVTVSSIGAAGSATPLLATSTAPGVGVSLSAASAGYADFFVYKKI